MGKYYVSTGNLRVVIARDDIDSMLKAAMEACLEKYDSNTIADRDIKVSEVGFGDHESDRVFDTAMILKKAGFLFE